MADLGPVDPGAIILETGTDDRPRPARGRKFTLAQVMKAVAVVAVGMALVRSPEGLGLVCVSLGLLGGAGVLYILSRLSPRIQLAIVVTIAAMLLIGFVRMLRLPSREYVAIRANDLARRYAILAGRAGDPGSSARLLRESEKFRRAARALDREATWYGLARFFDGMRPDAWDGRDFILNSALEEAEKECEATAARMGVRLPRAR